MGGFCQQRCAGRTGGSGKAGPSRWLKRCLPVHPVRSIPARCEADRNVRSRRRVRLSVLGAPRPKRRGPQHLRREQERRAATAGPLRPAPTATLRRGSAPGTGTGNGRRNRDWHGSGAGARGCVRRGRAGGGAGQARARQRTGTAREPARRHAVSFRQAPWSKQRRRLRDGAAFRLTSSVNLRPQPSAAAALSRAVTGLRVGPGRKRWGAGRERTRRTWRTRHRPQRVARTPPSGRCRRREKPVFCRSAQQRSLSRSP